MDIAGLVVLVSMDKVGLISQQYSLEVFSDTDEIGFISLWYTLCFLPIDTLLFVQNYTQVYIALCAPENTANVRGARCERGRQRRIGNTNYGFGMKPNYASTCVHFQFHRSNFPATFQ